MQPVEILSKIIRERRSVRPPQFKAGEFIPDEVIQLALDNANYAPNHGKTQPWHFLVYKGEGIKRLVRFQSELYQQESGDQFNEAKHAKLRDNYLRSSHIIAICLKRAADARMPEVEDIAAVAAAVQNLALTLHAAGFGGYWTTGGVTYYESAKAFFGLGPTDRLLGFYLAGVVAETPAAPARKPATEKSTWIEE